MQKKHFKRMLKKYQNGWTIISFIGVALILLPNFFILMNLFQKTSTNWDHIQTYMLPNYVWTTAELVFFTALGAISIGVTLAWLVAAYDFPGKRYFRWGLVLPLTIPTYIAAYTYSGMLSYTGSVPRFFRDTLQWNIDPSNIDIMSVPGAIFLFIMTLFPYVYLITKSFLEKQSASLIENARMLGKSQIQIFFQVVLPIARVPIVGGVSLVVLEVLNDYGVASYFGIQTFATGIFQIWFGMYDVNSAIRLAAILMTGVLAFLLLEKFLRNRKKYNMTTSKTKTLTPISLKGWKALVATGYCFIIFLFAFLIPIIQMISWAFLTYRETLSTELLELIQNTLLVAFLASSIILFLSTVIANLVRTQQNNSTNLLGKLVSIGYSIPASVLAIGVLVLFTSTDEGLGLFYEWIGADRKLVLSLSIGMVIFAYVIRYIAIGFQTVEAGFEKIGTKHYEASLLLGYGRTKTFFKIDLPMLKGVLINGFILTFVDVMKELPLTLILRPFNFETLATKTHQFAGDERIQEASIPALIIVLISMISVYLFYRIEEKGAK